MYHVEHIGLAVLLDKLVNATGQPTVRQIPLTSEPEAVENYINNEVPGTYRIVSVNRIEYAGLQKIENIVYQFVWTVPCCR